MLCTASVRPSRLSISIIVLMLLVLGSAEVTPTVYAEPEVVRTTPLDGEILQRTPTAVGVGFNESLDREESSFRLLNPDGSEVEGISTSWGTSDASVTLTLPRDFPDGVYTIIWHAVSVSDGTSSNGWSSFSVGNPEDANILTVPTNASGHQGPAHWLQIGSRFIALAGIAASLAIWPMWRGVVRPALGKARGAGVRTTLVMQKIAWISLATAMSGSLLELIIHSQVLRDASVIDAVMQTLGHDEWGFWWIVRMALLVLLGIALSISPWWYPNWSRFNNIMLWILSLAVPLPLVLSGHAIIEEVGLITTVTSSYLAILAISILFGGALFLTAVIRSMRELANDDAMGVLRNRFIWMAITAFGIAILTGAYLGSVFAGNIDALTQTSFGQAIVVQAFVAVGAIIVAGILLGREFTAKSTVPLASALTAILAVALVSSAAMDVFTPARTELVQRSVQTRETVSFDGRAGIFLVAPGRVGVNHWRLETPGTYLQTETEVFVDISSPDFPELGTKSVQMYRVQGNAFEHHGTELSLLGDWEFLIRIEEPGFPPSIATYSQVIGEENTTVNLPAVPWKFEVLSGLAGLSLVIVGIAGISTAVIAGKSPLRKEAGGLAGVAIALAVVVIIQGRIDPLLVVESGEGGINPNDMVMVARGEEAYKTYCASCHGIGLQGDGPLADALVPPPAAFSAPHTKVHSDEDLIYWIQYGVQGTAMPGFRSQLDDQQIRDVISFIYWWQQDDGASYDSGAEGTPEAALAVCEIAPAEYAQLQQMFQHGLHPETRRGTPLIRAADSMVSPEQTNDVMWTVEQLVNCANQNQFMSQIRLFTQSMMQEIFPQGASYEVTQLATTPSQPVDPEDAIVIQDVQGVNYLADGRIAVTVIFHDPAGIGVIPGVDPQYQVTLVLINIDGVWLIDEVR